MRRRLRQTVPSGFALITGGGGMGKSTSLASRACCRRSPSVSAPVGSAAAAACPGSGLRPLRCYGDGGAPPLLPAAAVCGGCGSQARAAAVRGMAAGDAPGLPPRERAREGGRAGGVRLTGLRGNSAGSRRPGSGPRSGPRGSRWLWWRGTIAEGAGGLRAASSWRCSAPKMLE